MKSSSKINGRLIGSNTTRIEKPLTVEAWRLEKTSDRPFATTTVQENGRFHFDITPRQGESQKEDQRPSGGLYFKLYSGDTLLADTKRSLIWRFGQENPNLEIEVDLPDSSDNAGSNNNGTDNNNGDTNNNTSGNGSTDGGGKPTDGNGEEPPNTLVITGQVIDPEGALVSGVNARLIGRSVQGEDEVERSSVNKDGTFQFQVKQTEKPRDFNIKVYKGRNLIGESDPCIELLQTTQVIVVAGNEPFRGPAEYDRVLKELAPCLGDSSLADLDQNGVEFLDCRTTISRRNIIRMMRAAQLSKQLGISEPLLYGMLRVGIPYETRRLLRKRPQQMTKAAQAAIDQHLTSRRFQKEVSKVQAAFITFVGQAFLDPTIAPDNGRASYLFDVVGLNQSQKSRVITNRLNHSGNLTSYWDDLRQDDAIGEENVSNLQLAHHLDLLTGGFNQLTQSLFDTTKGGGFTSLQDLARWPESDWINRIKSIGVPDNTPGRNITAKRKNYGQAIMAALETTYPTTALGARLAEANIPQAGEIGEFISKNPGFEFRQHRLDGFLKANPSVEVDSKTLTALKGVERLAKVTPDIGKAGYMAPLLKDGVTSAQRIQKLGRSEFMRRYSQSMGQESAQAIYNAAGYTAGLAQQMYMSFGPPAQSLTLPILQDSGAMLQSQVPEWADLFGSLDACSCEHCESVYSPAAYLVDIMQFLNDRGHLDQLYTKRPDLGEVKLDCANANTLMPYIDLVIEILEQAVVNAGNLTPRADGSWPHQTTLDAETLRVQPEHLKQQTYDILKGSNAAFPFHLPFNLWQAEADVYLGHLNLKRDVMLRAFSHKVTKDQTYFAATQLGIDVRNQYRYIGDTRTINFRKAWGYAPRDSKQMVIDQLSNVDTFLTKSGLSFDELVVLLAQPFINHNNLEIEFAPDAPCDLTRATINNLGETNLTNMHRFLRLQLELGWSIEEVGRAIGILNENRINHWLTVKIGRLELIRERLGLDVLSALSCWGLIDTVMHRGEASLYDRLFLNRSVTNDETLLNIFSLTSDRTELADTSHKLMDQSSHIIAALGIREEELNSLMSSLPLNDVLNLANLSQLYRHTRIAAGLGLTVSSYLVYWKLLSIDVFNPSTRLNNFMLLLEQIDMLEANGMPIEQVDYLLNHHNPTGIYGPQDSNIVSTLSSIRTELNASSEAQAEETSAEADENVQIRNLETIIQLMSGAMDFPLDSMTLLMSDVRFNPISQNEPPSESFLAIAPETGTQTEITEANFSELFDLYRYLDKCTTVLSHFQFVLSDDLKWYLQNLAHMEWLQIDRTVALPLVEKVPNKLIFGRWLNMVESTNLEYGLPVSKSTFASLVDHVIAENQTQFREVLLNLTGWDQHQYEFLTKKLELAFPDQFSGTELVKSLSRLQSCFEMIELVGVSAETLWAWSNEDPSFAQSLEIKQAVRAKYDEETWLSVAEPLRDELRDRQRDALVARMIHITNGVENENDLFGHLLIDVEMSPCMQTSRIKQAVSSVQLFIQRCFLNLEPNVTLERDDADEWTWMKRYRVWEANRKVFLYPESYIEPDLRDDKTEIFKAVESYLLQDALTPERAEEGLRQYLEGLDQVGALDIVGLYHDTDGPDETLHIIGRTATFPTVYFYRKVVNRTEWTPWSEIEVEIEGNHVLPVVYNRRLYLFWLMIAEKEPKEIKLAWSSYWNGKWTPKTISIEFLNSYWGDLNHKIRLYSTVANDQLTIYCSQVLPTDHDSYVEHGYFVFDGCIMNPSTGRENETASFDKPLIIPDESIWSNQQFALEEDAGELEVPTGTNVHYQVILPGSEVQLELLRDLGSPFVIQASHQFPHFLSQAPYAAWDNQHRFLIFPSAGQLPINEPEEPDPPISVDPGWDGIWTGPYVPPDPPGSGGIGRLPDLIITPLDPEDMFNLDQYELSIDTDDELIFQGPFGTIENKQKSAANGTMFWQQGSPLPQVMNGRYMEETLNFDTLSPSTGELEYLGNFDQTVQLVGYVQGRYHKFVTFYHPYVCLMQKELARVGVDGVLNPRIANPTSGLVTDSEQLRRQKVNLGDDHFVDTYNPNLDNVIPEFPKFDITFDHTQPYAQYNWELFFHVPFMIANRLNQNQQFEAAQKWYHYIFDPTDTDTTLIASGSGSSATLDPARFWKIRPFYENDAGETIQKMMLLLAGYEDPSAAVTAEEVASQVKISKDDPFDPHAIAKFRISAYQKAIVFKYIDNLIDWGDSLFAQDTIESINEATQLYLLADAILGKRPRTVQMEGGQEKRINGEIVETYNDLKDHLDEFSNALIEVENLISYSFPASSATTAPSPLGSSLFFCIPANEDMLKYWDTVADRLFKIRNCMNIEGTVRSLALYEPPIDPNLLIRATAAGLDLGTVLSDVTLQLPHYRFTYMVQKAAQFCSDVQGLGRALQTAIEKQDAEELAVLRATHETQLLKSTKALKKQQIDEAKASLDALVRSKAMAEYRQLYYTGIQDRIAEENQQINQMKDSKTPQQNAVISQFAGATASLIPNVGVSGIGPYSSWGGSQLAGFAAAFGGWYSFKSSIKNLDASIAGINAGYKRRADEWDLQATLAEKEVKQLDKQIIAAEIRLAIAEQDLINHEEQIANAEAIEAVMRAKFSNEDLYSWMVSQVSSIYFQSYQMAYDLAKKAQLAFRHELANYSASFISFGYWDSLNKGLLAGDMLLHDIRRMENAFIDGNHRELELTKHVSLAQIAPEALLMLRQNGNCFIDIPEGIFDLDYPGHYLRRIKSVSLTIPGVTGPYTTLSCTLTLNSNRIRLTTDTTSSNYTWTGTDDARFVHDTIINKSIATSSGVNDSGLFELNFRDERYLPFEGAGVISNWQIDIGDPAFARFDFNTIADVIFHINYTAQSDAGLKTDVEREMMTALNAMLDADGDLGQLLSVRSIFPDVWAQLQAADGSVDHELDVELLSSHFPYLAVQRGINVSGVALWKDGEALTDVNPSWSADTNPDNALVGTASFSLGSSLVRDIQVSKDDLHIIVTYAVS